MPRVSKTKNNTQLDMKNIIKTTKRGAGSRKKSELPTKTAKQTLKKAVSGASKGKGKGGRGAILNGNIKKPHRFRPGTVAAREVLKEMCSDDFAIPKSSFRRLVRQTLDDLGYEDKRMSKDLSEAIQTLYEGDQIGLFKAGLSNQKHCGRKTIQVNDTRLVVQNKLDLNETPSHLLEGYKGYMMANEIMKPDFKMVNYIGKHKPYKRGGSSKTKKDKKSKSSPKTTTTTKTSTNKRKTPPTNAKNAEKKAKLTSSTSSLTNGSSHVETRSSSQQQLPGSSSPVYSLTSNDNTTTNKKGESRFDEEEEEESGSFSSESDQPMNSQRVGKFIF